MFAGSVRSNPPRLHAHALPQAASNRRCWTTHSRKLLHYWEQGLDLSASELALQRAEQPAQSRFGIPLRSTLYWIFRCLCGRIATMLLLTGCRCASGRTPIPSCRRHTCMPYQSAVSHQCCFPMGINRLQWDSEFAGEADDHVLQTALPARTALLFLFTDLNPEALYEFSSRRSVVDFPLSE